MRRLIERYIEVERQQEENNLITEWQWRGNQPERKRLLFWPQALMQASEIKWRILLSWDYGSLGGVLLRERLRWTGLSYLLKPSSECKGWGLCGSHSLGIRKDSVEQHGPQRVRIWPLKKNNWTKWACESHWEGEKILILLLVWEI